MPIVQNLTQIWNNINTAIERTSCSRISDSVKLVAVTKNHEVTAMREAIDSGILAIGENRVQEAASKYIQLDRTVEWHLIGHLQTNKVRQAVPLFDLIHSVDSQRLAVEIDRVAGKLNKRQNVLLQVNVAEEETKFGLATQEVFRLAQFISNLEHVHLRGLMTIAPYYDNPEQARPVFRELYQLFMELRSLNLVNVSWEWLSMGMTNDYIVAVEEGANLVRIGTGIFGARQYE